MSIKKKYYSPNQSDNEAETMKEFRNPADVHPPIGGYTHQIEIKGSERILILSGQIGRALDGTVPEDPIEQLELAFENLERNLKAAGMEMRDIVKITLYLAGEFDTDRRREATARRLQGHQPCMTVLFVSGFVSPTIRLELDAWASKE
ncbi:MAG: RidA family protein [Anaerolineaceae bacterium]